METSIVSCSLHALSKSLIPISPLSIFFLYLVMVHKIHIHSFLAFLENNPVSFFYIYTRNTRQTYWFNQFIPFDTVNVVFLTNFINLK
jgi:hypothetical protein